MFKGDVLREFVTERLAAASRDIFAVVDRTVAGYEEEAAGLRREIDRQKKQLEAVLQPQVKLYKDDLDVEISMRLDPAEEEEGEDDEEEGEEDYHEDDVDYEPLENPENNPSPSRSGQSKKRKRGRTRICFTKHHVDLKIHTLQTEDQNSTEDSPSTSSDATGHQPRSECVSESADHLDLRIRFLDDQQPDVLSNTVYKRCPVKVLRCPRGLEEKDFLLLMRSQIPQLSANENAAFDLFMTDRSRRLQPITVQRITAEEILKTEGNSALYVRLRTQQKEPQASEDETQTLQTEDQSSTEDSPSTSSDATGHQPSSPVQEAGGRGGDVVSCSSTSLQEEMEPEEAEDEDGGVSESSEDFVDGSSGHREGDGRDGEEKEEDQEEKEKDDDWKPEESSEKLKKSKRTKKRQPRGCWIKPKTGTSDDVFTCKVCGALHRSEVALVKDAWSHVEDPGSLCGVCGELSESVEAFKDHLQSRHKMYNCHICSESFLSVLSLDEHVAAHSGDRPYKCNVCYDAFALKLSLENHQKLHVAGKLHKCFICDEVFELKSKFYAHRRTHTDKNKFVCNICSKSLSCYRRLKEHKMSHSDERPHSCQICGKRFKRLDALWKHKKTHTDREKSHLCDVCCKMFFTKTLLQLHMTIHTNEKPFQCGECGKGFRIKGDLKKHMRIHTGEKPYRCPECSSSFRDNSNLNAHMIIHSGVKRFVCGICGKASARKSDLNAHMRTHNGERPYKCSLCEKAFTWSHCLKTHMKSHVVAEAATGH